MRHSKLIFTLLLTTLFSRLYATSTFEEVINLKGTDYIEHVINEVHREIHLYTDKGIEKTTSSLYEDNMFLFLMNSYRYDDDRAIADNDNALTSTLNKNITKDSIINLTSRTIDVYDLERHVYSYERPVIKGLLEHNNNLKDPVTSNGAISKAIHISSERLLDLRKDVTTHLIGFIIFAIVYHFAFGMSIRLKTNSRKGRKNPMFIFIEIMIYIILIVIASLIINNKCRDYRSYTTRFLSETYKGALKYSYELCEEDKITDVNKVDENTRLETISDADFRALLNNMKYKTFDVPRFGFAITYPEILTEINVPYNGDGCTMRDKWGMITLETAGMSNIPEWNVDSLVRLNYNHTEEDETITYSKAYHQDNYYIQSGRTGDDMLFYEKGGIITAYDSEVTLYAKLTYPKRFKNDFEPVIEKIFKKYPIKLDVVPE